MLDRSGPNIDGATGDGKATEHATHERVTESRDLTAQRTRAAHAMVLVGAFETAVLLLFLLALALGRDDGVIYDTLATVQVAMGFAAFVAIGIPNILGTVVGILFFIAFGFWLSKGPILLAMALGVARATDPGLRAWLTMCKTILAFLVGSYAACILAYLFFWLGGGEQAGFLFPVTLSALPAAIAYWRLRGSRG